MQKAPGKAGYLGGWHLKFYVRRVHYFVYYIKCKYLESVRTLRQRVLFKLFDLQNLPQCLRVSVIELNNSSSNPPEKNIRFLCKNCQSRNPWLQNLNLVTFLLPKTTLWTSLKSDAKNYLRQMHSCTQDRP